MKINSFDILAPFYDLAMGIFRRSIPAKIFRCLKPGEKDVILDLGGGTGKLSFYYIGLTSYALNDNFMHKT